jgi:hypothetical protein
LLNLPSRILPLEIHEATPAIAILNGIGIGYPLKPELEVLFIEGGPR